MTTAIISFETVVSLVLLLVAVLLWRQAERRRIAALRQELVQLRALLDRAEALALSRRGSDGQRDERAEREYRRLMAEYDARWGHLRAECGKRGLHLPERPWRQP